jgi:hypothetical protein
LVGGDDFSAGLRNTKASDGLWRASGRCLRASFVIPEAMEPSSFAEHAARFRALPLASLYRDLAKNGVRLGLNQAEVHDAIQHAFERLMNTGAETWDYGADPTASVYLSERMQNWGKNERRRATRRRTDADTEKVEETPPSSGNDVQRMLVRREHARRARAMLLERLANNELACWVVRLCIERGQLEPAACAAELGEPVERIYRCMRRIKREAQAVARALESEPLLTERVEAR